MVKQRQPASTPTPETDESDFSSLHPLNRSKSTADKLLAGIQARKEADEFKVEELEEWKKCVNGLTSTPNGRMFIKSMLQHSGHWGPVKLVNQQPMVNAIRADFYLRWVKPYLQPDLRKDVEP